MVLDFDASVNIMFTPAFEGSKTTHTPGDLGGTTRNGLTQRNYSAFRQKHELPDQSIELADLDEIKSWYRIYCWDDAGCDKIFISGKDKLAFTIFNCAVNRSFAKAVSMLQEVLELPTITGYFGPITLETVNNCDEQATITKYLESMTKYYVDHVTQNPSQKQFIHDWLGRVNSVAKVVDSDYHTDPHQLD